MALVEAVLALEDGAVYRGSSCGARGERGGELVFNTSMTGYQEVLTDPSYLGQIVVMTYPLIGNYGVNAQDMESDRPRVEGFVVREMARRPSNWQATGGLREWLDREGVPSIEGIDTRELTERIRTKGAMRAVLSTEDLDAKSLVRKARRWPTIVGAASARQAGATRRYEVPAEGTERFHAVVVDFGAKTNILRSLTRLGGRCTVVPASASAEEISSLGAQGVLLSNGPGDPAALQEEARTARRLAEGGLAVWGICLGHQVLSLAFGARTYKLKFGHRGANHPVQDLATGRVLVTTHNHGFAVDEHGLPKCLRPTYRSLNDGTLEGVAHAELSVRSMQFHPEAAAGPHDAKPFFEAFRAELEGRRKA